MKTAEAILEKYWNKKNYMQAYFVDQQSAIIAAINEARKEAIEECAARANIKYPLRDDNEVNKQSILSLIKELK